MTASVVVYPEGVVMLLWRGRAKSVFTCLQHYHEHSETVCYAVGGGEHVAMCRVRNYVGLFSFPLKSRSFCFSFIQSI